MILIAQWFQPSLNIQPESVSRALDQLAEKIRHCVWGDDPGPSGGHRREPTQEKPAGGLDIATCRRMLDAANLVFQEEGYAGNSEDYYAPDNSFINRVLETRLGIPITLSLLYACVMGRLGVLCEPVNFPTHFLLRWLEHPVATTEQGKDRSLTGNGKQKHLFCIITTGEGSKKPSVK